MRKINRKKVVNLVGFIMFVVIVSRVFLNVTYLFRNVTMDRYHIVGLEQENVDMVYIGGSAAFVYWQPLKAWNDYGYTSYSYATNTIQAESLKAYVEEVHKKQNPELFVIGVRAFQYYSDEPSEAGIRNSSDFMDMTSISRYKLLNQYFKNRNVSKDTDKLSYYLDIAKYHTNTSNLASKEAWGFINNNGKSENKGWEWMDSYAYLDAPKDYETQERAELLENDKKILEELLSYCKSEKLNVLFVVCPYWITKEDQAKYNTIGDMIKESGFNYLNANDYYDEMKLDFSTDFYNKNHVNQFGAEKYTSFLEKYISDNYNLISHKGDSAYASWDDAYNQYSQQEKTHANAVTQLKESFEKSDEIQKQMIETQSLAEWWKLASENRFSLLIAGTQSVNYPQNISDQKVLAEWGIAQDENNYIRVINGGKIEYSNAVNKVLTANGVLGMWYDTEYYISIQQNQLIISIDDNQIDTDEGKINIVIFDNWYRKFVGNLTLSENENGKLEINYH